ncbi:fungal-specific transcription factor domain-containing protein, partial [Mycena galopus ATCC 62051]
MASEDENFGPTHGESSQSLTPGGLPRLGQRRPQRSCDICRQRKIRCDGATRADGCCSSCLRFGSACTYSPPKKRGRKNNMTLEELKKENTKLRSLSLCSLCSQPLQSLPERSNGESDSTSLDSKEPPDEQDAVNGEIVLRFSEFKFNSASSFALATNAIAMKENQEGRPLTVLRRPLFWDILPWEKEQYDMRPPYVYPPDDLIASLLDLYFNFVHPTIPILHRPSFEHSVGDGLHLTDSDFGGTLLSVLAVASRYSKDPRVFMDGDRSLSSGWKFASQLGILRRRANPSIYEVQAYFFLTLFTLGTSVPQLSWLYLGLGIRFLQQRGEHREKPGAHKPNAEDELWKRAFWSFIVLERNVCLFLGRPMWLHTEEYDLEIPLEVDDEYWDHGFIQPLGKPSQISYFIHQLRLCEILADAMRRLYGSKMSKVSLGRDGPDWDQRAVTQLDSAMNDFLDSIPLHLRWDTQNLPQGTFFDQSAILHISYNHVLIAIHRPFIQKTTEQSTTSLLICARAARTILSIADIWLSKLQRVPLPSLVNAVFISGVVLILYMLGTTRASLPMDKNKNLIQIATAMDILKFAESRLHPVGRQWEVLRELWSLDGPLPSKYRPSSTSDFGAASPSTHPTSAAVPVEYYAQPERSFNLGNNNVLSSEQLPILEQGMSIEQLLADPDPLNTVNSILDDELMGMWMAAPIDVGNISDWNAYIETHNIGGNGAAVLEDDNYSHFYCPRDG